MSGYLPSIVSPSETNAHGLCPSVPTPEKLRRTVQCICSSGANQNGYLKLLQGVRRRFGENSLGERVGELPLIVPPRYRNKETAKGVRFSDGVRANTLNVLDLETEEAAERDYVVDSEVWARRVVHEMMVVHYVTFVLFQEIEELQHVEREQRASLLYAEENERYYLLHESDVSTQLMELQKDFRAREEKQRRLAEQARLYPTIAAQKPQALQPGAPAEQDARAVLRRYIRLKHMSDADGSLPDNETSAAQEAHTPAAPVLAVPNAAPRKSLGIAVYLTLLEKHDEARRFLMAREQSEFRGIAQLFQEDIAVVWAWEHRRMHLERLLRWRSERDARPAESRAATAAPRGPQPPQPPAGPRLLLLQGGEDPHEEARHAAQLADEAGSEEEEREIIAKLEEVHFGEIGSEFEEGVKHCAVGHREAEAEAQGEESGEDVTSADHAMGSEGSDAEDIAAVPPVDMTPQWMHHARENLPQLVTLQRAVQRWRAGRFGWRYTHREIGRTLRAQRDEVKIKRGQGELATFRAALMAECNAVHNEILATHERQREALATSEAKNRGDITAREVFDRIVLHRKAYTDFLHDITEPAISQCIEDEENERRETDVREEFLRSAIYSASSTLSGILRAKQDATRQEVFARDIILRDEAEDRDMLNVVELDGRELLRIQLLEFAISLADARNEAAAETFAQQSELHRAHAANIAALQWRCRAGHLDIVASDDAPRALMFDEFLAGAVTLMDAAAVRTFCTVGEAALAEHAAAVECVCEAACAEAEAMRTALAEKEEAETLLRIARDKERMERERRATMDAETAAAIRIQRFFRAFLAGEVGRTATRRYLRARYAHKVEVQKLREELAVQRAIVRRAEDELRDAERELREEREAAVAQEISILCNRTEPRARRELEMLEDIIFRVIQRNVSARGNDPAQPDRIAVLWQLQSYERVGIMREWREGFESVFEPKKNTFVKDIMASKIQRAWRSAVRRRQRQVAIRQALQHVVDDEEEERNMLELNQIEEFACDVFKPAIHISLLNECLFNDVPQLLEHMCFNVSFACGIEEEEWRNRMLLLWRMRHHHVEAALDPEEEAERARVEQKFFYDGVAQMEMIEEEETIRKALKMERVYFLLRILVKEEREYRSILVCGFDKLLIDMYERQERYSVTSAYFSTFCESLVVPTAYSGAAVIDAEEHKERYSLVTLCEASKPLNPLEEEQYVTEDIREAKIVDATQIYERIEGSNDWEELEDVKKFGEAKGAQENKDGVVINHSIGDSFGNMKSPPTDAKRHSEADMREEL